MIRPDWDRYFMTIAILIATRSTCLRRQIGCVAVKNGKIITTGYNGACSGIKHCKDRGGCLRNILNIRSGEKTEMCFANHAEANAICKAANLGLSLKNTTFFITHSPCSTCSKLLINIGVKEIFYNESYPDKFGLEMLKEVNIPISHIKNSV